MKVRSTSLNIQDTLRYSYAKFYENRTTWHFFSYFLSKVPTHFKLGIKRNKYKYFIVSQIGCRLLSPSCIATSSRTLWWGKKVNSHSCKPSRVSNCVLSLSSVAVCHPSCLLRQHFYWIVSSNNFESHSVNCWPINQSFVSWPFFM